MRSPLIKPCKPSPSFRIALIAVLPLLLSGWTCSVEFKSCQGAAMQPQITSLSPSSVPSDANSVPLVIARKRFYSPIANHVERKHIGDHASGLTPPSDHDYSGDL